MTSSKKISRVYGVRPRKRLGQCFLHDGHVMRHIVSLADLCSDDTVIEIGAGLGVMTALIAAEAKQVIALEIDPHLLAVLQEQLKKNGNVRIVHTDVLKFDLPQAAQNLSVNKLKVIGNIPYHISTPILFHLIASRRAVSSAVLMVQKEVAERITAGPGTKSYGIPSVYTAVFAHAAYAFTVPASCFHPVPKVTSAVLKIGFRTAPLGFIKDEGLFGEVVHAAFGNRRKTLMNNLRHHRRFTVSEETLRLLFEAQNLDVRIRGEALTPTQFIALSNSLAEVNL